MPYLKIISSILVLIVFFVVALVEDKPDIGFYHWKSRCEIPSGFKDELFIKILDIGYDTKLRVIKTRCQEFKGEFTPVIYIDNQVFKNYHDKQSLVTLIKNTLKKYRQKFMEIQFDCDWTLKTRTAYFEFLKEFKDIKTSATIRLHQVKFFKKTGVPPVQSGVLMFYNMSNFMDIKTKNYILDLEVAKKYFMNFDIYPLHLDVALPTYSMATIIRDDMVIGMIDSIQSHMIDDKFKNIGNNLYMSKTTHYFQKRLLYEGDVLRIDEVSKESLIESMRLLRKHLKNRPKKVIFYRLDSSYDMKFLENLVKKI